MAARNRTVVFSQDVFKLSLVSKSSLPDSKEYLSFDEALAALKTEGASCLHTSSWGSPDGVTEVNYETWVESVLKGRAYHRDEVNYDWATHSPVRWVHWFGTLVPLLEMRLWKQKLEDTAEVHRRWGSAGSQWWLKRYEAALADPGVWKLHKGRVLVDGKPGPTVIDRCIDLYGPP